MEVFGMHLPLGNQQCSPHLSKHSSHTRQPTAMPMFRLSIHNMVMGIVVLLVFVMETVQADTNVTVQYGTTVSIQDHEVKIMTDLKIESTWSLADPTFAYSNDQLRSHPGRVTIGLYTGGITIANSSDDYYVQDLRIHYGQAEELYNATAATSTSPRADLQIADDGLSGLRNLTQLTLIGINFSSPDVTLVLPDTISFIEVSAADIEDLSLKVADISALQEIVLLNVALTTLPKFFYERKYPQEQLNITLNLRMPISMELPEEYYGNLKANLDNTFVGWAKYVSLDDSCSKTSNSTNPLSISVCDNGEATPVESGSSSADAAPESDAASESDAATNNGNISLLVTLLAVALVVATAENMFDA